MKRYGQCLIECDDGSWKILTVYSDNGNVGTAGVGGKQVLVVRSGLSEGPYEIWRTQDRTLTFLRKNM